MRAEDRLDGRLVALAERAVLREDGDRLAVEVVEEGSGGRDILRALAAGAEGVVVDARDRVGGGRARDEEHLVLLGLLGDREGDTRRGGAADDVDARADELLDGGDGLVGVAGVVLVLDGDRRAVDLARAVGGVVEAGLEAVEVLLAVAGERAGLARDDADRDLGRARRRLGRVAAGAAACGAQAARTSAAVATTEPRSNFFVTRMCVPFTIEWLDVSMEPES